MIVVCKIPYNKFQLGNVYKIKCTIGNLFTVQEKVQDQDTGKTFWLTKDVISLSNLEYYFRPLFK